MGIFKVKIHISIEFKIQMKILPKHQNIIIFRFALSGSLSRARSLCVGWGALLNYSLCVEAEDSLGFFSSMLFGTMNLVHHCKGLVNWPINLWGFSCACLWSQYNRIGNIDVYYCIWLLGSFWRSELSKHFAYSAISPNLSKLSELLNHLLIKADHCCHDLSN